MEAKFNHKECEARIYRKWKEKGEFGPNEGKGEHFSVVMPPPNVTGILHMGHALNNSLQDIIVRYHRMCGQPTLWVPGTDHAGIATQNVVERQLQKEGLRRQDLGREKFLERTWQVKEKHHDIIKSQLEKMGCSCDWDHERFTMDEGLSKAVREAFVSLYERGLIYKGKYLVNYCPKCGTALSDDEVEYENLPGHLYHVNYPYSDGSGVITVATTRPETMFGDVAVAVHPDDGRYKAVVGKLLDLPLTDKKIPIIADSFVDREFGTGMVKITPAHDPNDWECGRRNNLEAINILNPDGTLNANCPEKCRNLPAVEARDLVVEDLQKGGYLVKIEYHAHDVGHCYRCHTVIEPYLSDQWFVKMKTLADQALDALHKSDITFYPKRWENTYSHWMETIRDWCISRQLWWGHRIPVWYCKDCGEQIVSREDICECPKCHSHNIEQDTDVLDTWFSSWLWPFSTLGWPEKTPDFKKFFPTSTLVSAYDIIFFWISRMIMSSEEFLGKAPFKDIVITGLVRDKHGRKMAKSKGNGIDPNDIINRFGADSMKFTLCYITNLGQDLALDVEAFNLGSRFVNKIWNAARFIMSNLDGVVLLEKDEADYTMFDQWIYSRLNDSCREIRIALENYDFSIAARTIYAFFWNDFCDWYIEYCKQKISCCNNDEKNKAMSVCTDIFKTILKLMHPFLSFITEEINQILPDCKGDIINASYPEYKMDMDYSKACDSVSILQDVVRSIRSFRSILHIPLEAKLEMIFRPSSDYRYTDIISAEKNLISSLVGASSFTIASDRKEIASNAISFEGLGYECYLILTYTVNTTVEIDKLYKEISDIEKKIAKVEEKLSNAEFMKKAKPYAIDKEYKKKDEYLEKIQSKRNSVVLLKSCKIKM